MWGFHMGKIAAARACHHGVNPYLNASEMIPAALNAILEILEMAFFNFGSLSPAFMLGMGGRRRKHPGHGW
jgi:hypothetical protein